GRGFRIECRMLRGNDEHRWVLHTGAARYVRGRFAGHIGTSVDITDLKLGYERMMTAQKRESLGTLTAGIAHDFNTLLASMFAAPALAMFALPPDWPARENLARIYRAATRASEIVKLLMSYAETTKVRIERVDLSRTVAATIDVIRGRLPPNVELQLSLSPD